MEAGNSSIREANEEGASQVQTSLGLHIGPSPQQGERV